MDRSLTIDEVIDALEAEVARCTIGFLNFAEDDLGANATSAGSGTLAKVGALYGVLTAGHVIDHVLRKPKVGLVRFDRAGALQQQTIEISDVDEVTIYSK